MILLDLYRKINRCGNFMSFFGIADTHILCDSEDPLAYQPLDEEAYNYLRYCMLEAKGFKELFGEIVTYTGGDLTELERSSTRKVLRQIKKNDSRAQDAIHKRILNDYVYPKLKTLVANTTFLGGVAGNHLIEFHDQDVGYPNSEAYLIRRLGGKYCGEGKMLINLHLTYGKSNRCVKKILITHGAKGGNKTAIIKELQQIHSQYGAIDCIIKCHAHDPMTAFYARYKIPDSSKGKMKKQETLVVCLGSTRDGEKAGDGVKTAAYDDYSERFNYSPTAARFPVVILHAVKNQESADCIDVKFRPLTM